MKIPMTKGCDITRLYNLCYPKTSAYFVRMKVFEDTDLSINSIIDSQIITVDLIQKAYRDVIT